MAILACTNKKRMRIVFIILFTTLSLKLFAQDCNTSLLFKKGVELEYKTYSPASKGVFSSKVKFFEITRLTFIVEDVKDSNNVIYSYITKKGVAANNEKDKYEKKYLITCSNGEISLPFDFYAPDTVYLSDVYPKLKKKGFYTATNNKETVFYIFPLNADQNKFELSAKKLNSDVVMRDFGWEQRDSKGNRVFTGGHWELSNSIEETKYSMSSVLDIPHMKGKEKITTSLGSFNCDKFSVTIKSTFDFPKKIGLERPPGPDLNGKTIEGTGIFYFESQVGLVKTESSQGGYSELIRIKK
jgi:hypothetical protein